MTCAPTLRVATIVAVVVFSSVTATAQIPLFGNVSDGAGGPLLSGTVYTVSGSFAVATGTTLTVQPGAIVKFDPGAFVQLNGTMNVTASAGTPAVFTSIRDDTVGGDTNGDGGATVPAPGDWNSVICSGNSDASTFTGLVVRYTGSGPNGGIDLTTSDLTMIDCTVESSATVGLDLSSSSFPTVSGCSFVNNAGVAVSGVRLNAVPGFTNNTATGNGGDYLAVVATLQIGSAVNISAANVLGGALVIDGTVTVASAGSLTLGAGVVIKIVGNHFFDFSGPLTTNGAAGNDVVFTSFADDDHGGDTNGDGPSDGVPGDWNTIIFRAGASAANLTHTIVRYAGSGGNGAIDLSISDITMTDCTIRDCATEGLDCTSNSFPTVTGCHFENDQVAVVGVRIEAVAGFTNNTAANNAGDYMQLSPISLGTTTTWKSENVLGDALVSSSNVTVSSGAHLTIENGVVLKLDGNVVFDCSGVLDVTATAGDPAVITAFTDDSVGGDTNNDGSATTPAPGSWNTLIMRAGSTASVVTGLTVRYAGSAANAAIELSGGPSPTFTDCTVEFSGTDALDAASSAAPTVTGCAFDGNVGIAVTGVALKNLPGFTGNTATANGGNYIEISTTNLDVPTAIAANNVIGGALVFSGGILVSQPLTIGAGIVIKFASNLVIDVRAPLTCQGTAGNRVVFTAFDDDAHGGDTNNDGPSSAPPGSWNTIIFRAAGMGSVLDFTTVRYGGSGGNAAIDLVTSDITMTRCNVEFSGNSGIDLSNNSNATVTDCNFNDNQRPITGVDIPKLQTFRHNAASGNVLGDYALVTGTIINGTGIRLDRFNYPGDVVVFSSSPTVAGSGELTIGRGVNMKLMGSLLVDVHGTMNVEGTGFEPVVITSFTDDAIGGDTNLDGPTPAVPGSWSRVLFRNTSAGFVTNLHTRFGGSALAQVEIGSSAVRIRNLRVDHSGVDGVHVFFHAGAMENWIVQAAAADGITFGTNGLQVINATVVGCGGAGIDQGNFTGTVHNSIVWNNAGGNLVGFGAADVFNCDADAAFAGMNGNISTDPLLVDEPGGDFHLSAASPCIGAADSVLAAGLVTDHSDFSRLLDDDFDGLPFADMGAHERESYVTTFTGEPRMGTTMTFGADISNGPPAFAILIVGVLDGSTFVLPYGFVSVGGLATIAPGPQIAMGESIFANLPLDPGLEGFTFAVQAFALVSGNPFVGQITNRYVGSLAL